MNGFYCVSTRVYSTAKRLILASKNLQKRCKPWFLLLDSIESSGGVESYSTLARRSMLMTQFEEIKKQYQDYILLFQVGDFYEIYGDDASELYYGT